MAAKALVEAMRRSKKLADAKSLLSAMQSLAKQDIGGFTVNCGPGQNHRSKFVELAMVSRGGKLKN